MFLFRTILSSYSFIDPKSLGLIGDGYGGYLAMLMMNNLEHVDACAVVTQPIVDWKHHGWYFCY